MKLPNIVYTRRVTGSLGREGPYGPLRETSAIGGALENVKSAAQSMYVTHDTLSIQNADLKTQKAQGEWNVLHKDKQEYDVNDALLEGLDIKLTQEEVDEYGVKTMVNRKRIPAYEVHPQLYRRFMQATIESQSETITNEKSREKWYTDKKAKLDIAYANAMSISVKQQAKYHEKLTISNIKEAMNADQFILASEQVLYLKDDALRKEWGMIVRKKSETNDYDLAMKNEDLEQLYASLEILQMPIEEYKRYGYLDEHEQKVWAGDIKSHINRLESALKGGRRAYIELLKKRGREAIESLEDTNPMDMKTEAVIDLMNELIVNYNEPGIPSIVEDLRYARLFSEIMYPIFKHGSHVQKYAISNLYAKAKLSAKGGRVASKMLNQITKLDKMSDASIALRENDDWAYAIKYGVVKTSDYPLLDEVAARTKPGYLASYFKATRKPAEAFFNELGSFRGLMNNATTRVIRDLYEGASNVEKVRMSKEIALGAGDLYTKAFEQLHSLGLPGSHAAAGVIARYNEDTALSMYRGQDKLNDKSANFLPPNISAGLNNFILETYANAYPMDYDHKAIMAQGFKALFVDKLTPEEIKNDDWDDVVSKANNSLMETGGLIEHHGSAIIPPRPDFTQEEATAHINTIYPDELLGMNNNKVPIDSRNNMPMDTSVLMDHLRDNPNTILVDGSLLGGDTYLFKHEGRSVLRQDGNPYIYKFIKTFRTTKGVEAEKKAEAHFKKYQKTATDYEQALKDYNDELHSISEPIEKAIEFMGKGLKPYEGPQIPEIGKEIID